MIVLLLTGLIYVSCETKQASLPTVYPSNSIVATISKSDVDDGTYVYNSNSVKFQGDTLAIYGKASEDGGVEIIGIYIYAKQPGTYLLSNHNYAMTSEYGFASLNSFTFYTDSIHTGTVMLTKLDTVNHIVEGTFSFTPEAQQPIPNFGAENVTNGLLNNVTW